MSASRVAKRPYYYKAQLLDAIAFLESGRPDLARRLLLITLDVCDGRTPSADDVSVFNFDPTIAREPAA